MKETLLTILIILFLLLSCKADKINKNHDFHKNPVIAHRGAWKNTGHPQNSLPSLKAAIEMGCHGSELDVQLTKDDSLIVYHDLKHHGMVIDSTAYAELIKIPLKNGDKIPTLREYLAEGIKQSKTKLIIDIKTPKNKTRTARSASKILETIKELQAETWVEFLASDPDAIRLLLENTSLPVAYLGLWKNEIAEMEPENVCNMGVKHIDYQDIHYKNNAGWIDIFKEKGIHLNVWTVNSAEDMNYFLSKDFNYITTDEPELLLNLINNKQK